MSPQGAPQPRGLPTGFEELLASVGVSLLDEDYGMPIPSTPYQAPSPPSHLAGEVNYGAVLFYKVGHKPHF
jgi:hypothetical protein